MNLPLPSGDVPHLLPVPTPNSPVVLPQWISPGNANPNGRYQESIWPLGPLIVFGRVNGSHCDNGNGSHVAPSVKRMGNDTGP
jgi:hypothetical protein